MKRVSREAFLLLLGIPIFLWSLLPIYHIFLFAISSKDSAFSGALWPDKPTVRNFETIALQHHFYLHHFWIQIWEERRTLFPSAVAHLSHSSDSRIVV